MHLVFTIEIVFEATFSFLLFPSFVFLKIRKDAEMQNLAKRYLAELIKGECWNSMAVKGRALKVTDRTSGTTPLPMKIFMESLMAENFKKKKFKKIHI